MLSLTSTLGWRGWSTPRSGHLIPGFSVSHCTGGWVGLAAGLEGCGISHPQRGSNPETSSQYRVAIHLSGSGCCQCLARFSYWYTLITFFRDLKYRRAIKFVMQTIGPTAQLSIPTSGYTTPHHTTPHQNQLLHFVCSTVSLNLFRHEINLYTG